MTDEGMVNNDVPSPTRSTVTATREEEESTVPDNDQKEETTMAAELILPPGKLYAGERALQVDLADWAVWHGFGLLLQEPRSRKGKTAATSRSNNDNDDDGMCVMVCTNPPSVTDKSNTNNSNSDTTQSPHSCTFAIAYEKLNGHHSHGPTMVRIAPSSVYRHSCECRRVERNASSSPAARTKIAKSRNEWIKLTQGKEFSRLLYTNPVCFLSTHKPTNDTNPYNVMVISWLTATNNNGDFMFSLNKNRHSASVPFGPEFTLSVPVQGMESLVCNVGGVSGKWGISKFAQDHRGLAVASTTPTSPKTNKKHKGPKFPRGIPGLVRVPLGQGENQATEHRPWSAEGQSQWPFAIQGTIAHLLCQVQYVMNHEREAEWIDTDHCIVFAQVKQAFVHGSYWNESKKLFQPRQGNAPYLTFFGSQTFGYVAGQPLPTTSLGYH